MTPIDRMLIEHSCQKLILQYARLNDEGRWEDVAALYTDDATFARPSAPQELLVGKAAILESFKSRGHRITQHIVTGTLVDVVDHQTATAISTLQLFIGEETDGAPVPAHKLATPFLGEFHDRLTLTEEGWRFTQRRGALTIK